MKNKIKLNKGWSISNLNDDQNQISIQAEMPTNTYVELVKNDLIQDPYYSDNAANLAWVEAAEWLFETEFDFEVSDKTQILCFESLDTFATIYLNGSKIGETNNMFRSYHFDVSDTLKAKDNQLKVQFSPAAKECDQSIDMSNPFNTNERLGERKAQFSYGWDWAQRFISSQIGKDVYIYEKSERFIDSVFPYTVKIEGNWALVATEIILEDNAGQPESAEALFEIISPKGETVLTEKLELTKGTNRFTHNVGNVELWWPNNYGEQPLYQVKVQLLEPGTSDGATAPSVAQSTSTRFGIRKVELVQQDDEYGRSYDVYINYKKIYMRGSNWVPGDSFYECYPNESVDRLLELAKEGKTNMLRIWGGGVYPDSHFFGRCDELGICLFVDQMFACGEYPEDKDFIENVKREVEENYYKHRHHTSIAIWCGNNENSLGQPDNKNYRGKRMFEQDFYAIFSDDKSRPYVPTSPIGWPDVQSMDNGDAHVAIFGRLFEDVMQPEFGNYDSFDQEFRAVHKKEYNARFASEVVAMGTPPISSLKQFLPEHALTDSSADEWNFHFKTVDCFENTVADVYRKWLEIVYGSEITQPQKARSMELIHGYFVKLEVENYRRKMFRNSGTLFWMYNDCWPAISWSMVDYFLMPKCGYYQAKNVFNPVLPLFDVEQGAMEFSIANDLHNDETLSEIEFGYINRQGKSEVIERYAELHLKPGLNAILQSQAPADAEFLFATCKNARGEALYNDYEINLPKDKTLKESIISAAITKIDDLEYSLKLSCDVFAYGVQISFDPHNYSDGINGSNIQRNAEPFYLSDNYFNIPENYEKEIRIKVPKGATCILIDGYNIKSTIRLTECLG